MAPNSCLTAEDVERFIRDGFIRLEAAFPRSLADECRGLLWAALGLDPVDPSTWRRPVIRLPGSDAPPFVEAANTPRLLEAFDQLAGAGRWYPRPNLGTFPIRFPSVEDPGDAGWHIDGSYKVDDQLYVNLRSRERALLLLFLFSDVGPDDAPTRIRVGSHLDVPPVLKAIGEGGMPFDAQPPLSPVGLLNLDRADGGRRLLPCRDRGAHGSRAPLTTGSFTRIVALRADPLALLDCRYVRGDGCISG